MNRKDNKGVEKGNIMSSFLVVLIIGIISIGIIIIYIIGYGDQEKYYGMPFILLLYTIAAGFSIVKIIKYIKYLKYKNIYEKSSYFLETKFPYSELYKTSGLWFEAYVYNELIYEFGKDSLILLNLIIPRLDSINEFSEIDILMFHKSGIYCLELKDIEGYIYGNITSSKWNIGYKYI